MTTAERPGSEAARPDGPRAGSSGGNDVLAGDSSGPVPTRTQIRDRHRCRGPACEPAAAPEPRWLSQPLDRSGSGALRNQTTGCQPKGFSSAGARPASGASLHTSPGSPMTARILPTSSVSPSAAPWCRTTPAIGEGISTTALAVSTSTSTSSTLTEPPTGTTHRTMSASVRPLADVRQLELVHLTLQRGSNSGDHSVGARRVVILSALQGHNRIPSGDSLDRRVK